MPTAIANPTVMLPISDLAEDRLVELVLSQGIGLSFAMHQTAYEIAETWADAILLGEGLSVVLERYNISNWQDIVSRATDIPSLTERQLIIDQLFIILEGGGADDIPTAKCIRSKLPKRRRPTEEELRRAFKECSKST